MLQKVLKMHLFVRFLLILALSFNLAACSRGPFKIYKKDIRQGNYVTQEMVNKLEPNLTKHQVQQIMGTSTFISLFHDDRWDYRYRFIPGDNKNIEYKVLTLYFKNNRLYSYSGDWEIKKLPKN